MSIVKYNIDLTSIEIMVPHQSRGPNKPYALLQKQSTSWALGDRKQIQEEWIMGIYIVIKKLNKPN